MLLKEASITMESEYEMPVIVPLTQGSLYQFVFIMNIPAAFMKFACSTGMKSKLSSNKKNGVTLMAI
jgi:hypothetical protein